MRNVSVQSLIARSFFVLSSLALFSCTKTTDVDVSVLSSSLPALKNTGSSPFEQGGSLKHFVVSGTCVPSIIGFQLQIDNFPWTDIQSTAPSPSSGETVPTGAYDVDCSDKAFRFWFYDSQFNGWLSAWGVSDPNNYRPHVVRIRGKGGIFYSDPMVFVAPEGDGHGGGGHVTPDHLAVRRTQQPSHAISSMDYCVEIVVSLHGSNGQETSVSSPFSLSVLRSRSGVTPQTPSSSFTFYPSWQDCQSMTNQATDASSVTFPTNSSMTRIYYRTDAMGDQSWDQITFAVGTVSGLSLTGVHQSMQLEIIPYMGNTRSYISFSMYDRMVKGICYPLKIGPRHFDNHAVRTSSFESLSLVLSSSEAKVKIYSNSSCSALASGLSVPPSNETQSYYIKADADMTATSSTLSATGDYATETDPDPSSLRLYWDDSTRSIPKALWLSHHSNVYVNSFNEMRVTLVNEHGTPVPATSSVTFNFSSSAAGKLNFVDPDNGASSCSFSFSWNCATPIPMTSVNMAAGMIEKKVLLHGRAGGQTNLSVSSTGLTSAQFNNFSVFGFARMSFISPTSGTSLSHFACQKIEVRGESFDWNGTYVAWSNWSGSPWILDLSGFSSGGAQAFSDPQCQVSLSGLQIPDTQDSASFYWRPVNLGGSPVVLSNLTVSFNGRPEIDPGVLSLTVQNAPNLSLFQASLSMGTSEALYPHTLGNGGAPFSFNLTAGPGSLVGTTGLNTVKFVSDPTGNISTLELTDAHPQTSAPISVTTTSPSLSIQATSAWLNADPAADKLRKSIFFFGTAAGSSTSNYFFSRSSSATYVDHDGWIATASSNEPRFTHRASDPNCSGGACERLGLLLEPSSTNYVDKSTMLTDVAAWPTSWGNGTFSRTTTTGPDGFATSATRLTYSGNSTDFPMALLQNTGEATIGGASYSFSLFVRKGAGNQTTQTSHFKFDDSGGRHTGVAFDFNGPAGSPRVVETSHSSFLPESFGAEAYRDGWYRVWFSFVAPNESTGFPLRMWIVPGANYTSLSSTYFDNWIVSLGNSYQFDLYGPQIERESLAPSSYIPCATTGSGCARTADQFRVLLNAAAGSWGNLSQGTMMLDLLMLKAPVTSKSLLTFSQNAPTGDYLSWSMSQSGGVQMVLRDPSTFSVQESMPVAGGGVFKEGNLRVSASWDSTARALSSSNALAVTAGATSMASGSAGTLYFNADSSFGASTPVVLKQFKYWSSPLSNPAVHSMGISTPPGTP